jgi:hypothetical protein
LLVLPGAVAAAFALGNLIHVWISWVGMVGCATCAAARSGVANRDTTRFRAGAAVVAAGLGGLAFVLATTYITWPRYYLPVVPALVLASALGLESLRGLAVRTWGVTGSILVGVSVILGVLSVTAAYPDAGHAKPATLLTGGGSRLGQRLLVGSVASFALLTIPLLLVWRRDASSLPWRRRP